MKLPRVDWCRRFPIRRRKRIADDGCPLHIVIRPDEYHAMYVGRTEDGRQFFSAVPFVPEWSGEGREFQALYLFDADGNLLEAQIEDLGTRAELEADLEAARQVRASQLAALGTIRICPIEVKPFSIERFGVTFGLIPEPPDEISDHWWVSVQPGDYMAFRPPWDGRYDT